MFVENFVQDILQQHKIVRSKRKIRLNSYFRHSVNEKSSPFCDVTRRRLLDTYRRFGTDSWSHRQWLSIPKDSCGRDQQFVPKRRWVTTNLSCITSKKTEDFIEVVLEHATKAYVWVVFSSTHSYPWDFLSSASIPIQFTQRKSPTVRTE